MALTFSSLDEFYSHGFDTVIDVQGADHIEQFPYVRAAVAALGCPAERIELVMHQFVTLTQGGEQVKQSTRRATYVPVDELVAELEQLLSAGLTRAENELGHTLALPALPEVIRLLVEAWATGNVGVIDPDNSNFKQLFAELAKSAAA